MKERKATLHQRKIFEIQSFLSNISRVDKDIPRVNPDGIYGETTEKAVWVFQDKYGLRVSGRVDFPTFRLLLRRSREAEEMIGEPLPISPFATYIEGGELILGDKSDTVATVKTILRVIGSSYPIGQTLSLDGIFDEETEEAVMDFQAINGLLPTGRVDKLTWNRLSMAYNKYLNTI